jgi:hypothetical protein
MAIQGRFEYKGIVAEEAYVKIEELAGGHMHGWRGAVRVYYNKEAADVPGSINALTEKHIHSPYVDGENPYTGLYAMLKQEPEFTSFIDV